MVFFPIGLFEVATTAIRLGHEVPLVYLLAAAGFGVFLVGVLWVLAAAGHKKRGE